ncbi:hypothetical protein SAMN04488515_1061 [Cognatiyoonia koreensis]|uniref:Alpha/beta hydrolase family protein n=1 Tax=Cognatiyoonia koreensis TaxID=364200 RepID=A0A1I0P8K6_9RHOB|nr:hypothetical protein [Cognatiyoonia koreensis]SEW10380.1 hypothetical protein SAMN04488515_1061 [Cognatiyoonia koreensis]
MVDTTILDETANYRITRHLGDQQHDTLVVTFAGQPGQMAEKGFGTDFALKNGYETVYVAQRYESHFQGLSLDAFQDALRPVSKSRRVVCYGSSLGAYAALYYGGTINAEVLAGAPMLPSWTGFQRPKYHDLMRAHIPLADVPKSDVPPIILTDPKEPNDILYMEGAIKPAFPHARYVELPYAGHTVLKTIEEAGMLSSVVKAVFETGEFPEIKLPTKGSVAWHINVGNEKMREKDRDEALRHGEEAFKIDQGAQPISLIIRAATALGDFDYVRQFVNDVLTAEHRAKFVDKVPVLKRMVARAFDET